MPQPDREVAETLIPEKHSRVPASAWWMLAVLLLYYTMSFVQRIVISMVVDPIKATLHLSDVQIGLVMGPAFALSYCVFGVIFGWVADRFSRRMVIFGGVTLWSICAALCGAIASFPMMMLSRVGVGAGEAALTPAAYSMIADRFPPRRLTIAIATYQMGSKLGSAAAFTLGSLGIAYATAHSGMAVPFLGVLEPWQLALVITALPGIPLALLCFTIAEPKRGEQSTRPVGEATMLVPFLRSEWKALTLMAVGFALIAITLYSLTAWVPAYLGRHFHLKPIQYGPVISMISVLSASSMLVKGMVVDWLYGRNMRDAHLRFYTWLLAAVIPLCAIMFFVTSPWLFLVLYGVVDVVALQFVVFSGATLQLLVPPSLRGQVTGLYLGLFTLLGLGAGPTLTAALTDYVFRDESKLGMSLAVSTCITVPGALLFLRLALGPVGKALARVRARADTMAE
jgi:MFS family permease